MVPTAAGAANRLPIMVSEKRSRCSSRIDSAITTSSYDIPTRPPTPLPLPLPLPLALAASIMILWCSVAFIFVNNCVSKPPYIWLLYSYYHSLEAIAHRGTVPADSELQP